MKFLLSFFTFLIVSSAFGQSKGSISGTLTDLDMNNEPLPFANVMVKGTTIGTTTDENGKYSIDIAAGSYTVMFSFLGYESETATVTVVAGKTSVLNKGLGAGEGVKMDEVILTATVNREKESALLMEQKGAIEIKQSIGAQEMSRKGVNDVSGAVVKTSGVTKQEGSGNIFVRGLGDRYNSTSMNGLPVASNEPEKKNINLELFSTDIVEMVSIDKVYSNKTYGDFGGASVDVVSKDYNGDGIFKIDVGSNINTNAISEKNFLLQQGYNQFGFSNKTISSSSLNQYTFSTMNTANFNPIATSIGLTAGKSYKIGEESKLSIFATASTGNDYSLRSNGIARGGVNANGTLINRDFNTYTQMAFNTNTTGMANINFRINRNHKIGFNTLFVNASSLSKEDYTGFVADLINDGNGFIRRNKYEQNKLSVNQLLGEHKFGEKLQAKWGVSYNKINGDMPDRTQNVFIGSNQGYLLSGISRPDNHRYFQNLVEDEYAANLSLEYKFKKNEDGEYAGKITVGYNAKDKLRNLKATQFNLRPETLGRSVVVNPEQLDLFYNQNNFENGFFSISTFRGDAGVQNALNPQFYKGYQNIQSGYLTAEYKFSSKLYVLAGFRAESIYQKVNWNTQIAPEGGKNTLEKNALLPNIVAKYALTKNQNLRLAASKTYSLPQFKERALFLYEDVGEQKFGNPFLYASDNYNFDLKWETFPSAEQVISIGGFGKYIQNPINEVITNSATNDISYVNSGSHGTIFGLEFESRILLFGGAPESSRKLTGGLNTSVMWSNQILDNNKVRQETQGVVLVNFTNTESRFTGASKYLVNADLTYIKEWNNKENSWISTITFSRFSDRIYALGGNERGDLVDKAFYSLDFINKFKLSKKSSAGIVARNLLDPKIKRVQANKNGDVTVLSYNRGVNLSLSYTYQF